MKGDEVQQVRRLQPLGSDQMRIVSEQFGQDGCGAVTQTL